MTADRALAADRAVCRTAAPRGFRQAYLRAGRGGEPIALLHGESETSRIWSRDIGPLAAAGFDVVAPDRRGCGDSDAAPDGGADVASHGADLYALLRHALGFERVTLVGRGLGGAVARHFALRFPGFAARLVLFGAAHEGADPTETLFVSSDSRECGDLAALAARDREPRDRPARARAGVTAFVGLGSNLGDRERRLCAGFAALRRLRGVGDVVASRVYETDPVGPGGPYLNAAARLRTSLAPHALLEQLLAIERAEGRERTGARNEPRTLDLDLLLHGDRELAEPDLVVPHPRLAERPFVLEPLCDLAPDLVVPGRAAAVAALAAAVRDSAAVRVREA